MLAPQQALDHIGPVQAVNAVHTHDALLPLLVTRQGPRLEEALTVEVLLDGVPQCGQTASKAELCNRTLLQQVKPRGGFCSACKA